MSKSLIKLWLHGSRRLVAGQVESVRVAKPRPAEKPARAKTVKSKLKSGAAAWARSYYSAPPVAGCFVNRLSYALYVLPKESPKPLPLVVMLHGCKSER